MNVILLEKELACSSEIKFIENQITITADKNGIFRSRTVFSQRMPF